MIKKYRVKLHTYLLLFLLLSLTAGCGQFTDSSAQSFPSISISAKDIPPGIERIELSVSASDMPSITETFGPGTEQIAVIVPSGLRRTFTLTVYTASGTIVGAKILDLSPSKIVPITINFPASFFSSGDEGWFTYQDAQDFEHRRSGGNPGGYVWANDRATGQYWYFSAPPKFLGDMEGHYGRSFAYELFSSGGAITGVADIILGGPEFSLEYQFSSAPSPGTWDSFSIAVTENEDWINSSTEEPASEAEIRAVLSDLQHIYIRGEYQSGGDNCGLDNVHWE